MIRLVRVLAVLAFSLCALPSSAQEQAPPQQPQPTEATPVVEAAPAEAPAPVVEPAPAPQAEQAPAAEAWQLYEAAFNAAVAGRDDEALANVARLRVRFPESGAAALGAELARQLETRRGGGKPPMEVALRTRLEQVAPVAAAVSPGPRSPSAGNGANAPSIVGAARYATLREALHDEKPTLLARAEFVLFQSLHGIALGVEACALSGGCGYGVTLLPMLTGGAAAWGAFAFSADGITAGHALAIDSGVLWGVWHGIAITGIANRFDQGTLGVVMASQLVGMAAGHFAWRGLGLSAGDMSLMNSAGIWTPTFTLLFTAALGMTGTTSGTFTLLLVASDVGLLGGALLAQAVPMSRGRTLLLDAGVVLGGLLGWALNTTFNGTGSNFQATAGSLLVGGLAGAATAGFLTRDWDLELVGTFPAQVGLAPTPGGGAQLVIGGRL